MYESDRFFDFCDSHGIMVWQDFGQWAAAFIRRTRAFQKKLADEAVFQIKRLRNRPRWRNGQGI